MSSSDLYTAYSCMANSSLEIARVVIQRVSSALSIVGSSYILKLVWGKWRKNESSIDPYQRIMAMYSIYDILFSFFHWFLGTWATPAETGWWGAAGNTRTCTLQGFFFSMGYGQGLYQIALSLQMLLLVNFGWTSSKFQRVLERKIHFFIAIIITIIAVIPLFFQGYNPICGICVVVPTPVWCGDSIFGDGTTECVRGNATLATVYFSILWGLLVIATLFCTGAMIAIYLSVYRQEKTMISHRFDSACFNSGDDEGKENHAESIRIRKTMLFYTSSFYICWILPTILWFAPHTVTALFLIGDALYPLMGLFNMLAFIQPKCLKYQRCHPGTNMLSCYCFVLFSSQIGIVKRLASMITSRYRDSFMSFRRNLDSIDVDDGIGFQSYNEHHSASTIPTLSPEGTAFAGQQAVNEAGGAPADGIKEMVSAAAIDCGAEADARPIRRLS